MTNSPAVPLLLLQLVLGASIAAAQPPTPNPTPSPTPTALPAAGTGAKPDCAKDTTKVVELGELPRDLSEGRSAQLQVTTCSAKGGALTVTAPAGFTVQPASQEVTGSPVAQSWIFNITPPARDQVVREGWIRAELRLPAAANQPAQTLGTSIRPVSYRVGQSVLAYFALGLLGIALGYVLRKVVKALAETTPTNERVKAAVKAESSPGWLKQFVADHYYAVDFAVTIFLGFLLLGSALTVDHIPPIQGQYWFGALLFGFATGLLTNSELITNLPVRA